MENREINYFGHPITCSCEKCMKIRNILREYERVSLFKCSRCGWKSLRYNKKSDRFVCLNPYCQESERDKKLRKLLNDVLKDKDDK